MRLGHELKVNIPMNLHSEDLIELSKTFQSLPGYHSSEGSGIIHWFGTEDDDEYVVGSFQENGFALSSEMDEERWIIWMAIFIKKTREALGYEVNLV